MIWLPTISVTIYLYTYLNYFEVNTNILKFQEAKSFMHVGFFLTVMRNESFSNPYGFFSDWFVFLIGPTILSESVK